MMLVVKEVTVLRIETKFQADLEQRFQILNCYALRNNTNYTGMLTILSHICCYSGLKEAA